MENKNEQVETMKMEKMTGKPSKCEVIGAVISVGVLGFWFGIGAALGIKMVNSLEGDYKQKIRLPPIKWKKRFMCNKR